jgi:hypothetical protein
VWTVGWMMVTLLPITWLLKPLVSILFGVYTALTLFSGVTKNFSGNIYTKACHWKCYFLPLRTHSTVKHKHVLPKLKTWTLHQSKQHEFIGLPPQKMACFVLPPNFCIQKGVASRHHIAFLCVR